MFVKMLVTTTKEEVKMTTQEEAKVFLQKMYLIEQLMRSKKISDDTKVSLNRYMVLYYPYEIIKDEKTKKYIIDDVLSRLSDEKDFYFGVCENCDPSLAFDITQVSILIEKEHRKWEYVSKNIIPIKMRNNILLNRELEVINS